MNEVKKVIDRMKTETNSRTYDELAVKLGIKLSAINSWKRRGFVPEKNLLKCVQMTNTPLKYFEQGIVSLPLGKDGKYTDDQLASKSFILKAKNQGEEEQITPPDIANIIEILKEFDTKKRRAVLLYVLELDASK